MLQRSDLRLHWLSWLVFVLTGTVLILICVPGMPVQGRLRLLEQSTLVPGLPHHVAGFEHGWPLVAYHRALGYSMDQGSKWRTPTKELAALIRTSWWGAPPQQSKWPAWSEWGAWTWESDAYEFSWLALIVDVFVFFLVLFFVTVACEVWVRRRGGAFRWRIIDMMALVLFLACALGWWYGNLRTYKAEESIVEKKLYGEYEIPFFYRLSGYGGEQPSSSFPLVRDYCGPVWLARLCGSRNLLWPGDRFVELDLTQDRDITVAWEAISNLSHLRSLVIHGDDLQLKNFLELSRLSRLEYLNWNEIPRETFLKIAELRYAGSLSMSSPSVFIEDLEILAEMEDLKEVHLQVSVSQEELEEFAARYPDVPINIEQSICLDANKVALRRIWHWHMEAGRSWQSPNPQKLDLVKIVLTDERLQLLSAFLPHVKELKLGQSRLTERGLNSLNACGNLTRLDLGTTILSDSDVLVLQRLPAHSLSLTQGQLTLDGLKAFAKSESLQELRLKQQDLNVDEIRQLREELSPIVLQVDG